MPSILDRDLSYGDDDEQMEQVYFIFVLLLKGEDPDVPPSTSCPA